jgi:hypothetical protein
MLHVFNGVCAVELSAGATPRLLFERANAQALAQSLAFELQRQLDSLDGLGLVWMAAAFDSAQLLRPGLPVFNELKQLYQAGIRDPLMAPQVMTLSALRGSAPSPVLQPDPSLQGSLLYIPFVLLGSSEKMHAVAERLERQLMDQGLLDARAAFMLVDAFECKLEHARLLSLDDLAALTAANLDHAGLPGVWPLIEAALFSPQQKLEVSMFDCRWQWREGKVTLAIPLDLLCDEVALMATLPYLRQVLLLLQVHAITVEIEIGQAPGAVQKSETEADLDAGYLLHWFGKGRAFQTISPGSAPETGLAWFVLIDEKGDAIGRAILLKAGAVEALSARFRPRH